MIDVGRVPTLALTAVLALSACREPAMPVPTRAQATLVSSAQLQRGRAVYNFRCYFCHGYSGDAKTLAASYMSPPPRDFTSTTAESLPIERIRAAVRDGRPGTGMKAFRNVIPPDELDAVTAFVFDEFVVRKARNTRYHTPENGWARHERYRAAFPFALGEIPLTQDWNSLTPEQQKGRRLYLEGCVSCHDRGRAVEDTVVWDPRPLSYPRNNYDHRQPEVDATTSATPYRLHDQPPRLANLNRQQKLGETLFQQNCAFCHAADGTGKNWIGSFLEPHPRNLTDPAFMSGVDRARLRQVIRDGLPETSMPAWKSVLTEAEIEAVIAYVDRAFHPVRP